MKRTTGGHCDRKGEWVRWKQDLQRTSHPSEVVVVLGAQRVREETASPVWLYWNLEALAAEARQETRLVSTSKAWLLTSFPSKESQTFISCMCLLSSIWLWSVLPCSVSQLCPTLNRSFCKTQSYVLSYIYIMPFCFQKRCFSQHQGNIRCFASAPAGSGLLHPSPVHSTWDSFLKGESQTGYSTAGSPTYFQELHSLKSLFALLMHV